MAGIQGQPTPKPQDLQAPVPGTSEKSAFDSYMSGAGAADAKAGSNFDSYMAGSGAGAQEAPVAQGYHGIGSGALQLSADIAPTALGIAGGIVGAAAGPPGMAAMGMTGAAAGMGYRQFIEQELLGKPAKDPSQNMHDVISSAGQAGAELLAGEGVLKVAGKAGQLAAKTQLGQAVSSKVSEAVTPVAQYIGQFTDRLKKQIIAPVADYLEANMAKGTAEQSGDTIIGQIKDTVLPRYNGFKDSYARMQQLATALPMPNEARYALSGSIRNDVIGMPQQLKSMALDYAKKFDQSLTSDEMHAVIGQVDEQIAQLSAKPTSGAVRDKLGALQQISERATNYMENHTFDLAKRVADGKASMSEMQAFEGMMKNQPFPSVSADPANIKQYTKSVAKDYLDNRAAVQSDYARFRGFLSDVAEQTGVKAEKLGPMQFMQKLQDVPSEQLVERMFLPKNAAALREMQKTSPEIFEAVKQARVRDIYNKSMVDGQLNIGKLADNFAELPESGRSLIISDPELASIRAIAESGSLKAMDRLHENTVFNFIRGAKDITHTGMVAAAKVARDVGATRGGQTFMKEMVGKAAARAAPAVAAPAAGLDQAPPDSSQ